MFCADAGPETVSNPMTRMARTEEMWLMSVSLNADVSGSIQFCRRVPLFVANRSRGVRLRLRVSSAPAQSTALRERELRLDLRTLRSIDPMRGTTGWTRYNLHGFECDGDR